MRGHFAARVVVQTQATHQFFRIPRSAQAFHEERRVIIWCTYQLSLAHWQTVKSLGAAHGMCKQPMQSRVPGFDKAFPRVAKPEWGHILLNFWQVLQSSPVHESLHLL